jgi:hypothetical protein
LLREGCQHPACQNDQVYRDANYGAAGGATRGFGGLPLRYLRVRLLRRLEYCGGEGLPFSLHTTCAGAEPSVDSSLATPGQVQSFELDTRVMPTGLRARYPVAGVYLGPQR